MNGLLEGIFFFALNTEIVSFYFLWLRVQRILCRELVDNSEQFSFIHYERNVGILKQVFAT